MSYYCAGCTYDPKIKTGPKACPFNYLYWHFLIANETLLKPNSRLTMPYRTLVRMTDERRQQIAEEAQAFLTGLSHH